MNRYIFNNLDPDFLAQGSLLNRYDGWEKTSDYDNNKINKITDTQSAGGIGYFKLGTSIPTPFARIFMFRNAFNRMVDPRETSTIYSKLVSECLDFIEFIYHYGDSIDVKKWSFADDFNCLKGISAQQTAAPTPENDNPFDIGESNPFGNKGDSPIMADGNMNNTVDGHTLLADCLLNQRSELGLKDTNGNVESIDNIYLFYYQGVLIGGTSPFTLVFTSPNWQRRKPIDGVMGDKGNILFPNYQDENVLATPLHERHKGFIQFMMAYRRGYANGLADNPSIINYIDNDLPYIFQAYSDLKQADDKLKAMGPAAVQTWFEKQYEGIQCSKALIYCCDVANHPSLPLAFKKSATSVGSDYTIKTEKTAFEVQDAQGTTHTIKDVMVLSQAGLSPVGGQLANYIGGTPWKTHEYSIDPNIVSTELQDRILPGPGKHKHPFITVYDLFEDYIIRVPYTINSKQFETSVERDWNYLLPLKKLFFRFFDKDFLAQRNLFSVKEENDEVTFELKVPVTFNPGGKNIQQYLKLEKTYQRNQIKDLRGSTWFAMALYPSYRIVGPAERNDYTLMMANGRGSDPMSPISIDMKFYDSDDMNAPIDVVKESRPDDIKSIFYRIRRSFDFIETTPNLPNIEKPLHALIVPKFVNAYIDDDTAESNWKFGIDFGTSNTYIAATQVVDPETFTIDKSDIQVMYLDKFNIDSPFGSKEYVDSIIKTGVGPFHDAANREFAPMIIGENGIANYPFQTITCESNNFVDVLNPEEGKTDSRKHLFSKISIGFNVDHEEFSKNYIYRSDIKWAAERETDGNKRQLAQKRSKLYFEQIAWMLKNKLVLSSKDTVPEKYHFTVYFTYPCSMGDTEIEALENNWKEAFGPKVDVKKLTESAAPYYYLARAGEISEGKNFLNIDIGGGTTDMFYVIQEGGVQKSYYTSMRFAGNDLWGDGVRNVAPLTNGFYKYVKERIPGMKEVIRKQEDMLLGNPYSTMTSADLMAFLFRIDQHKLIPNHIQTENRTLYPLLIVHFGAILYHVAMILKEKDWDIPKNINLTGMGSKYVQIIAGQKSVGNLTAMLLEKFSGKKVPNGFKLTYSEKNAKEITAQGALYSDTGQGRNLLSGDPTKFQVYGFPTMSGAARIKYKTVKDDASIKEQILDNYENFIKALLEDEEIQDMLTSNFHQCQITDNLVNGLRSKAEDSFTVVLNSTVNDQAFIPETLFFWPLKNAIYELSKELME